MTPNSSTVAWTGTESLELGATYLLEASAGTGKTWQIEALVVRLVAEYGVPIERILVITFTIAATAELRERVRRRLAKARDALAGSQSPADDVVFAHLWSDASMRSARLLNVTRALSAFDLAPISTIHAFSQRTLEQFAFESGLEPGLELLVDTSALRRELVADELASVYDDATEAELRLLSDMGWSGDDLSTIASSMIDVVAPRITPPPSAVDVAMPPSTFVRRWLSHSQEMLTWLDSAEGLQCVDALVAALSPAPKKSKNAPVRPLDGKFMSNKGGAKAALAKLRSWLSTGAARSDRWDGGELSVWFRNLTLEHLDAKWKGSRDELDAFAARPLFQRVSALVALQDELWPLARTTFAASIRARVHAELSRRGLLTYNTMLSLLAERIEQQGADGPLASAIRHRYHVALVDEFQDTDAAQWPVLKAVFAHPERRLLIIGDPKQAIYSFRGADVHVYLDAASVARQPRATMTRNRRSDADYVQAVNHVFVADSGVFGLDGIDYVNVDAHHAAPRLRGIPTRDGRTGSPLELRWFDSSALSDVTDGRPASSINKGAADDLMPRLCANEIARLLSGGVELLEEAIDGGVPTWRALTPGDIAVLVPKHRHGDRMHREISALNIPVISAARGSVLESRVVDWLCAFLIALAEPGRLQPARTLAVTPLFGWSGDELIRAVESRSEDHSAPLESRTKWDEWVSSLTGWANRYARDGFIRVFEAALDDYDVLPRILPLPDGERYATDLRHIAELCHAEERRTRLGPAALAAWLRRAATTKSTDAEPESLRLESDARAVQIVTIHKSKGLEYPVVMLPYAWDAHGATDKGKPVRSHAFNGGHWQAALDLHPKGSPERDRALQAAAEEATQESMRMLYVALTRARHHCVAWVGAVHAKSVANVVQSPLLRVLSRPRDPSGRLTADAPEQTTTLTRITRVADTSAGTVGFSIETPSEPVAPPMLAAESSDALRAIPWTPRASLASAFQVASYSSLAGGHTAPVDEPHRPDERLVAEAGAEQAVIAGAEVVTDAGEEADVAAPSTVSTVVHEQGGALSQPAPLAAMLGGTEIGTWVHAVLEELEFSTGAARDASAASALTATLGQRHGIRDTTQHQLLTAGLPSILDTPLDGASTLLPAGFCLRKLAARDRIDELGFDLRLGDGNRSGSGLATAARVIDERAARLALQTRLDEEPHWLGASWLRGFLERDHVLPTITGILTGFIDLVLRAGDDPRRARYYVADYKTNRIAAPLARRDSRLLHYTQPWLHWEMERHSYPLQALLYTVALHRLLQQRLGSDYDYEQHVGGYLYLFLRGMQGSACDRDGGLALGVLHDRWPRHVVFGLDAALCGVSSDDVARIIDAARPKAGTP